ncbi:MAG TPA: ABC transporter permease [Candidatus Acidoferrales bacterium]|nr:ABC transporter permease [Candidatus Acidoferrales bacterium]
MALGAIFWKDMKHHMRYPGNFLIYLLLPFLFTFLILGMGLAVGGNNFSSYFAERTGTTNVVVYEILGSAVWMISWVVVEDVGVALRDEQIKGTLEQNFLAPINRITLLVGLSLADITVTSTIFFVVVGIAVAVTAPSTFLTIIPAFFALLLGLVPLFGICFLFAGFVVRFKEPYIFTQIVNLLFATLTGTYYPVTFLPSWLQIFSRLLPQTYVIGDMRQIMIANQTIVSMYGSIFVLLALALAYPAIGYAVFKKIERRAGVTGEFSKY